MSSMKQQPNNGNGHGLSFWKYSCCGDIHLLPHTHSFSRACPALMHDPCSGSSPRVRDDLWKGGQPHRNLPWSFAQIVLTVLGAPTALWEPFQLTHIICEASKLGLVHEPRPHYFENKWMDYLKWPLFNTFIYDTFLSISVLWSTTTSDTVLKNCCTAKKCCNCPVGFCYSSTLTYLPWLNLFLFQVIFLIYKNNFNF